MKNFIKLSSAGLFILIVVSVVIEARQPANGPAGRPLQTGQAQQPPPELKNIRALKGMTYEQVQHLMAEWKAQVGITCIACHVIPFDSYSPRKQVARWMQSEYVMGLKHKDGSALSCNDCHGGELNPLRVRPFEHAVAEPRKGLIALKGMSNDQLISTMVGYNKALGVDCNYCHTGDASNNTPRKEVARYMIMAYTNNLVKQDGSAVTCDDCHQGSSHLLANLPFTRRDLSGEWAFNPSKSQNIGPMSTMQLTTTIRQVDTTMILTEAAKFNGQDFTRELRFDLKSRPTTNKLPTGEVYQTISKWKISNLVTTWTNDGSTTGDKVVIVETRYISTDGRLLTVETVRGNERPMVMVFDKK